jgi:hypothetical protein
MEFKRFDLKVKDKLLQSTLERWVVRTLDGIPNPNPKIPNPENEKYFHVLLTICVNNILLKIN